MLPLKCILIPKQIHIYHTYIFVCIVHTFFSIYSFLLLQKKQRSVQYKFTSNYANLNSMHIFPMLRVLRIIKMTIYYFELVHNASNSMYRPSSVWKASPNHYLRSCLLFGECSVNLCGLLAFRLGSNKCFLIVALLKL